MFKIVLGPISGDGVACGELCDLRATRFGWRQVITAVADQAAARKRRRSEGQQQRATGGAEICRLAGNRVVNLLDLPGIPPAGGPRSG